MRGRPDLLSAFETLLSGFGGYAITNARGFMPTREEPHDKQAETDSPGEESASLISLVDLFDQIDRAAFRRSLRHRDSDKAPAPTA